MAFDVARPMEGTRGRILEQLVVAPRTAKDLARSIGIRESAARGHLERLEHRGFVTPTFSREGVGRPRKRYRLTPAGHELFPRRYDMLLDALMDEMVAREGEGYVSALFAQAARRMAERIAETIPAGAPQERRATVLVEALDRLGFRCSIERTASGELRIVRHNCIFRHSALAHGYLLCEVFDKHLSEALYGASGLTLQETITRGSPQCAHLIQLQ